MADNLINISNLVLSDTFSTWYDKTNQIVDAINPIQIYDITIGATSGLRGLTGTPGNYNGVLDIALNPGPGLYTRTFSDGSNRSIVDFRLFDQYGLSATGASSNGFYVQSNDEVMFNSITDLSSSSAGTVKKVKAKYMLPPLIDLSNIQFSGNVVIGGSLQINGASSYVAQANLRLQNKQFELAYQEAVVLGLTGVTSGTFSTLGVTAYHFSGPTGTTSDRSGTVQAFTGPASGPTGNLTIGYPFGTGGVASDFSGSTGYISYSSTGNTRYVITNVGTVGTRFLSDVNLSGAGMVAKGASGDKTLLWQYYDTDTSNVYNAWTSNSNFAVLGNTNSIISRLYRSLGYTGISESQFIFASEPTQNSNLFLTQMNSDNSGFTAGSWRISKQSSGNNLVVSYGATGIDTLTTAFTIIPGASGTTYSGIGVTNFAQGFNADFVDGAHALTSATAFSIPVSNTYGRIPEGWLDASVLRKEYTQTAHGFVVGDVVRMTLTGTVKALAADAAQAEAVGVVSEVRTANTFVIVNKGYVSGMSGPRNLIETGLTYSAGQVYFLSGTTAGKMISDPDVAPTTKLSYGQIRKPIFLATSETDGYIVNYPGSGTPVPTDEIYIDGLVPIGTIYAYAGDMANLGSEWLLCDGTRYRTVDYPDLYGVIGRNYYAEIVYASTGTTGTITGGLKGLVVGDFIDILNASTGATVLSAVAITAVSATAFTITTGTSVSAGTYKLKPVRNSNLENLFFVPDLRSRVAMGGTTGTSYPATGLSGYVIGDIGGTANSIVSNVGSHVHSLGQAVGGIRDTNYPPSEWFVGAGAAGEKFTAPSSSSIINSTGSNLQPYLVVNYVIRARANVKAAILTGHNHDTRYIKYNETHDSSSGLTQGGRNQFKTNAFVSGVAIGSLTSGDYHDHDRRYVRFDGTGTTLGATSQYVARYNIGASITGEGDTNFGATSNASYHNHDGIYVRYDGGSQAFFTETKRNVFLTTVGALNISGGTMTGGITFSSNTGFISGLTSPSDSNHAANKWYVDNAGPRLRVLFDGYVPGGVTVAANRRVLLAEEGGFSPGGYFFQNLAVSDTTTPASTARPTIYVRNVFYMSSMSGYMTSQPVYVLYNDWGAGAPATANYTESNLSSGSWLITANIEGENSNNEGVAASIQLITNSDNKILSMPAQYTALSYGHASVSAVVRVTSSGGSYNNKIFFSLAIRGSLTRYFLTMQKIG